MDCTIDSSNDVSSKSPVLDNPCSVKRASSLTDKPLAIDDNQSELDSSTNTMDSTPLLTQKTIVKLESSDLHQGKSTLASTSIPQAKKLTNSGAETDSKEHLPSVGVMGLVPSVGIAPVVAPMPGVGGGSKMREIRERAKLRRQLVAQQLGVWCPERLGEALGNAPSGSSDKHQQKGGASGGVRTGRHRRHHGSHNSTPDLVSLYTDSTTFLKGTQSANPHNDYCQHFVDTGQRPQNFIRDVGLADRFEEYPKLRELIKLKDDLIAETASPPSYLKADLHHLPLASLRCEFDVILVEPPLEEYQHTAPGHAAALNGFWDWNQIRELDIAQVAAPRSFIFLWVGSSEGLDEGRRCLRSWGFRRCEDICWIRTNSTNPGHSKNLDHKAVFQRTKEHCLMGIKGTVRRSTDGDFIHANVDIDLIITEEGSSGTLEKPVEIFHIIEHFCLGKRRLHLFGRDPSIRPGWLTVGPDLSSSNFDPSLYASYFSPATGGLLTTGCTDRIEALRPKSPPPKPGGKTRGGYTRGRGRGR